MAVDMFLKLDPLKGESTDKKHKEEIDVISWSWGIDQTGTFSQGQRRRRRQSDVQISQLHASCGQAPPTDLLSACVTGKHIPNGVLVVRKAGGKPLEYIKIKMEDILVTSVLNGRGVRTRRSTGDVTLNFAKFKLSTRRRPTRAAPASRRSSLGYSGRTGERLRFEWQPYGAVPARARLGRVGADNWYRTAHLWCADRGIGGLRAVARDDQLQCRLRPKRIGSVRR